MVSGDFEFDSVGSCGLDYSRLFSAGLLTASEHLFDCNAAIYEIDEATRKRSELEVDGANAYDPAAAWNVTNTLKAVLKGAPSVVANIEVQPDGSMVIHEIDPIVECSPETIAPPTAESCKEFVPAGVQLERTWQTSDGGAIAWMTDTWRSTDGKAHALNALYDQELVQAEAGSAGVGAYEFPGTGTFAGTTKGQALTLPSGASEIYYKVDSSTPEGGDETNPQGAIVYDSAPTEGLAVYRSTSEGKYNGFEMPYQRTVPAGGTTTLRMAFVQAYALPTVQRLSSEVLASYHPTLTIESPSSGSTVSSSSLTVSGHASDTGTLTSVSVNGKTATLGSGGSWSASVTLNPGANAITAVASDEAGLTTTRALSVTYTPVTSPPPPPPPGAKATQVGTVSTGREAVSFTVSCEGEAGSSCEISSTLTTSEKVKRGKAIAVSAKHSHAKVHTKTVGVGSSTVIIPAGQRLKITLLLNSSGKSLLSKFGKLPMHLSVTLLSAGAKTTIISENVTLKSPPRKHRGRKHKR